MGDKELIALCAESAWKLMVDAVINTYHLPKSILVNDFLPYWYENPLTGATGEMYLGYKAVPRERDIYLRKQLSHYLPLCFSQEKRVKAGDGDE